MGVEIVAEKLKKPSLGEGILGRLQEPE